MVQQHPQPQSKKTANRHITTGITDSRLSSTASTTTSSTNQPRNLLITDATQPFTFSFRGRSAVQCTITVNQSPDELTWPGGALWDLGVLLSEVMVGLFLRQSAVEVTLTTRTDCGKSKSSKRSIALPTRILERARSDRLKHLDSNSVILELGAGCGLTGLVAGMALNAKVTVLTDLNIVVEKITLPNLVINSASSSSSSASSALKPRTINNGNGKVIAAPLCWGNIEDETKVTNQLKVLGHSSYKTNRSRRKTKGTTQEGDANDEPILDHGKPSLILIGDVAYQHKPGAPSHFDDLLSTLLKFSDRRSVLIFGTRTRMPASEDLLRMFLEHYDELVEPPLTADEIDPSFSGLKNNMTIHFLQLKR
jgi:predicted nicotinamide N-methyase